MRTPAQAAELAWSADKAACYGTACQIHGTCQRWHAVENNRNELQGYIDNCGLEHALYIAVIPIEVAK